MSAQPQNLAAERPRSGRNRHVPFSHHLGIEVDQADGGTAVLHLTLAPHLRNNHGGGHGGVVTTLLDAAMAHAALSRQDYAREVVTVDLHVAFLAAATGDRLVGHGRATGGGHLVFLSEHRCELRDEAGSLIAGGGSFRD